MSDKFIEVTVLGYTNAPLNINTRIINYVSAGGNHRAIIHCKDFEQPDLELDEDYDAFNKRLSDLRDQKISREDQIEIINKLLTTEDTKKEDNVADLLAFFKFVWSDIPQAAKEQLVRTFSRQTGKNLFYLL